MPSGTEFGASSRAALPDAAMLHARPTPRSDMLGDGPPSARSLRAVPCPNPGFSTTIDIVSAVPDSGHGQHLAIVSVSDRLS
jgi:hypothetical protein